MYSLHARRTPLSEEDVNPCPRPFETRRLLFFFPSLSRSRIPPVTPRIYICRWVVRPHGISGFPFLRPGNTAPNGYLSSIKPNPNERQTRSRSSLGPADERILPLSSLVMSTIGAATRSGPPILASTRTESSNFDGRRYW